MIFQKRGASSSGHLTSTRINANNMVEAIRLWSSSKTASRRSLARIALVVPKMIQYPARHLRRCISAPQKSSKASMSSVTRVVMS
eukprot:6715573-Pyramimonas_sp.AAC.1